VGYLGIDGMVTLEQLQVHENPLSLLAPVDALLSNFPRIELTLELAKRFQNGQRLALNREPVTLPEQQGRVRVYLDSKLLGTALLQEWGVLQPERLIANAQAA
jgi:tRNA pseudouridine55 synthase